MKLDPLPAGPQSPRGTLLAPMLCFAAILIASALGNSYTVVADHARSGDPVALWAPMVWEFTSHLLIWLLIPVVSWVLTRFPLDGHTGWRSLAAHGLATLPFSLLHTAGMVLLRKAAYGMLGRHYDFGPFWGNWPYEYRKDWLVYVLIVLALAAFRIVRIWRAAHAPLDAAPALPNSVAASPNLQLPLDRLVVNKRNREFILDTSAIDRIDADGNYVVIHAAGESYRLRDSLEGLARRLGERRFARVHRTHVVNIDRVREIQPWDHGDFRILLQDGSFVNFSRRYRGRLKHLFP